ncbi:hypothetical protein FRC08_001915 [Ceratobasidium sp. 394]|nr:hypothetical protein FRC08_001915 [Ceratobasidium sp. 394]
MAGDLVGWKDVTGLLPYGNRLKETRKLLHEGMSIKAMEELWPLQEHEAIQFIGRLLETPEEFIQHIRQTAGATVLKLAYGYDVQDRNDPFIVLADKAVGMFSIVTTPGAFLVDTFPLLRYLPWAPFKAKAKEWRKLLWDLVELPLQFVVDQVAKGEGHPSLTLRWLEREIKPTEQSTDEMKEKEMLIKWAAMSLYAGGADTTVSSLSSFFSAMVHYPSVQQAAQDEIQRVVGTDRLPTYSDRDSLPYIEALYKEVLRWHPVTPLGLPHTLSSGQDDVYQGMRIPKGAMILPNIWRMTQDPRVYRDPSAFNPGRFLGPSETIEQNPEDIVFGFGRRQCPGINVAHSSVWLSVVLTLAVYEVTPTKGPDGQPILPDLRYTNGTISHPEPFQCTIKPRSTRVMELVKEVLST